MLELWGMWSIPLLPLLPGLLWTGVVAPDWAQSMGQIELNCVLRLELFEIKLFICIKIDLVLNNLQWLICHQTKNAYKSHISYCEIKIKI